MGCGAGFLFGIVVTGWLSLSAIAADPSQSRAVQALLRTIHVDDFQSDSRSQYVIDGAVVWERGKLVLGPLASIRKSLPPPSLVVELKLLLNFPSLVHDQESSLTRAGFQNRDGRMLGVELSRTRKAGKSVNVVNIVSFTAQGTNNERLVVVRTFPLTADSMDGTWQIRCRNLLVEVIHEGKTVGLGYVEGFPPPLQHVYLSQTGKPLTCSGIELTAPNPAPSGNRRVRDPNQMRSYFSAMRDVTRFQQAADVDQALIAAREAAKLSKELFGADSLTTASAQDTAGELEARMGHFAAAQKHHEAALEIWRSWLGDGHPLTAKSHGRLAQTLRSRGELTSALEHATLALQTHHRVFGENHPWVAQSHYNFGTVLAALGEYQQALASFERSLRIRRQIGGDFDLTIANTLQELGRLMYDQGDYVVARSYFERAISIYEGLLGPEHPATARARYSLAILLWAQGDLARANALIQEAIRHTQAKLKPDHPDIADMQNSLGMLLVEQGRLSEATALLQKAFETRRQILGPRHPSTAHSLRALGCVAIQQRDYAAGRRLLEDALAILAQSGGEKRPISALVMGNLGGAALAEGKYPSARNWFERALRVETDLFGDRHPRVVQDLVNLTIVDLLEEKYEQARQRLQTMRPIHHVLNLDLLTTLGEAEALAYVARRTGDGGLYLTTIRRLDGSDEQAAYQVIWDIRQIVTRVLSTRRADLPGDETTRALWQKLWSVRTELARLTLSAVDPKNALPRQRRLIELNQEKEDLERQVAKRSTAFRRLEAVKHVEFSDLIRVLPADVAVVDLPLVGLFEPKFNGNRRFARSPHYQAFVIRKRTEAPGYTIDWLDLGLADPIDKAVEDWRAALVNDRGRALLESERITKNKQDVHEATGHAVRRLVWEPIERHLQGYRSVVVIPDQALTRVPWAALPGKRPKSYLLEDYAVGTASSGHQVFDLLTHSSLADDGMLLVGGVAYDESVHSTASDVPPASSRSAAMTDAKIRPTWPYLSGTVHEIGSIRRLITNNRSTTVLQATSATEAALRQEMPKCHFVHLATHGFFADAQFRSLFQHDVRHESAFLVTEDSIAKYATIPGRNPMLLSGLVLVGANAPRQTNEWGVPIGEDGILTAEEVVQLDLSKCEMVVLSACETGLGDVAGGEGVFGLQRAFHMAGARTTIASLWKVHDAATQALMVEFYRNLWDKKLGKLEALRQAQLAMLKRYDPTTGQLRGLELVSADGSDPKPPASSPKRLPPFYWAAFVLSGDWR